jgi:anti-sigma factor RsiW
VKTEAPNALTNSCPDVEVLLGWLDDELDPSRREAVGAHLETCSTCAETLRALEARSEHVSAWLARHDPAVPDRSTYDLRLRSRTPFWRRRWAIVVGVVVAVGVAAGPARAWLLARLGLAGAPTAHSVGGGIQVPTTATAFVPRGSAVTVSFDAGVTGRTLTVTRSVDTHVSLDAAASSAEVVVGPNGFDVHDASQPPLAYRLSVPSTVTTVRIHVPGAQDVVVRPDVAVHVVAIPAGKR